jgi:hypothetical protein
MAPPKIVIATLLWKRHELFRVWAEALLDAVTEPFDVLVAGSEGDESRALVEGYGFHYLETPNAPIGAKANARFAACEALDPDFVILCGSDDIVSAKTFAYYRAAADIAIEEVTINDIYYLNAHTGEMAYSPGYVDHRRGEPIAPWRMISRRLCEALGWHGWDPGEKLFLDSHIYRRLKAIGHVEHRIRLHQQGLFVCDVKSEVNMTPWIMRKNWERIDRTILHEALSERIVDLLDGLRGPIRDRTFLGVDYLR